MESLVGGGPTGRRLGTEGAGSPGARVLLSNRARVCAPIPESRSQRGRYKSTPPGRRIEFFQPGVGGALRASVLTGNGTAKSLKKMVGPRRRCPARTYCLSKTSTLLKGLPSALVPIVLKVRVFPSGETERMKTVINFPFFMDIPSKL